MSEQGKPTSNAWPNNLELSEVCYRLLEYYTARTAAPNSSEPEPKAGQSAHVVEMMCAIRGKNAEGLDVEERLFVCRLFDAMLAAAVHGKPKPAAMLNATGLGELYIGRKGKPDLEAIRKAERTLEELEREELFVRALEGMDREEGFVQARKDDALNAQRRWEGAKANAAAVAQEFKAGRMSAAALADARKAAEKAKVAAEVAANWSWKLKSVEGELMDLLTRAYSNDPNEDVISPIKATYAQRKRRKTE